MRNESSGEKLLQSFPTHSFPQAFLNIFVDSGLALKDLVPIISESEGWKLDGFICSHGFSNNSKQFVFVNKRWVRRSRLVQVISKACKDSTIIRSLTAYEG